MKTAVKSVRAKAAMNMLINLQNFFVNKLTTIEVDKEQPRQEVEWLRDGGIHGGGMRIQFFKSPVFNRASLNVSQVHYDDQPQKTFSSASALSVIIHPHHPLAPSMHMHISWTEFKGGKGSWRIMADLNPAIVDEQDRENFEQVLKCVSGEYYEQGRALAERYFTIPALQCTRGVSHFYLEQFIAENKQQESFPQAFAEAVITGYCQILRNKLLLAKVPTEAQIKAQLDYHTLYFYQVLTLDKGTTTGLLIHDQNDLGILASLPAKINRELLAKWIKKTVEPQNLLLERLVSLFDSRDVCLITDQVKYGIAKQIREHYTKYPMSK